MSTTRLPLSPEKGLISNKEFIQKILGLVASTGIPIVKKNQYFDEKLRLGKMKKSKRVCTFGSLVY